MAENVKKFQTFDGVEHDIEDTAAREGLNNVYTKAESDALLANKVDSDEVYSKAVLNAILDSKADEANVYSKTATDDLLAAKADAADVYTKAEEDAALALKADAADVYTKTAVDALLADKADVSDVYSKTDVDAIVDDYTTKATFAAFQTDVNAEFQNRYTKSEDDALLNNKANINNVIGFPDYANAITSYINDTNVHTYTAPSDGFVYIDINSISGNIGYVKLNNKIIDEILADTSSWIADNNVLLFVKKDDVIEYKCGHYSAAWSNHKRFSFVPFK